MNIMGWLVNQILTTWWTTFYYLISSLVFESLGKGCRFEGWIDIPQKGGKIYIGDGVHICRRVVLTITKSAKLYLGDNSYLGVGTIISAHGNVTLGRDVLIGEYACIYDNNHETGDFSVPISKQGFSVGVVVIEDGCWIGAGAKILKDVRMGKNSILGAGAVLNKTLEGGVLAGGVPAKILRHCRSIK